MPTADDVTDVTHEVPIGPAVRGPDEGTIATAIDDLLQANMGERPGSPNYEAFTAGVKQLLESGGDPEALCPHLGQRLAGFQAFSLAMSSKPHEAITAQEARRFLDGSRKSKLILHCMHRLSPPMREAILAELTDLAIAATLAAR